MWSVVQALQFVKDTNASQYNFHNMMQFVQKRPEHYRSNTESEYFQMRKGCFLSDVHIAVQSSLLTTKDCYMQFEWSCKQPYHIQCSKVKQQQLDDLRWIVNSMKSNLTWIPKPDSSANFSPSQISFLGIQ